MLNLKRSFNRKLHCQKQGMEAYCFIFVYIDWKKIMVYDQFMLDSIGKILVQMHVVFTLLLPAFVRFMLYLPIWYPILV